MVCAGVDNGGWVIYINKRISETWNKVYEHSLVQVTLHYCKYTVLRKQKCSCCRYPHPYQYEIDTLKPSEFVLQHTEPKVSAYGYL